MCEPASRSRSREPRAYFCEPISASNCFLFTFVLVLFFCCCNFATLILHSVKLHLAGEAKKKIRSSFVREIKGK